MPDKATHIPKGSWRLQAALAALAALLTVLAYLPGLENGFVQWDDNEYVYENPSIRSINLGFIRWALTSVVEANWHPLTVISFAADYSLWGLNPFGYHLTNTLLHGLNTSLVFLLALRLLSLGLGPGLTVRSLSYAAFLSALLFGLHPIHVESVAWISERKDVLCGFFFLLSLVLYLEYASSQRGGGFYLASLVTFTLSLMSKPIAVTLPPALLILDFYPLGRLGPGGERWRRALLEKVPFFILGLAGGILTIYAQSAGGTVKGLDESPLPMRISNAIKGPVFYLSKMVLPENFAPLYPMPLRSEIFDAVFFLSLLTVLSITVFCALSFRKKAAFSAAWAFYVVTLLPVLGLLQAGSQAAADRYAYLPSLAPSILAGGGAALVLERSKKAWLPSAVFLGIMAILSVKTIMQEGVWKDSMTLWTHQVRAYPGNSPLAYNNLGLAYEARGDYAEAIRNFSIAIKQNPAHVYPYNNRGMAYQRAGDPMSAIRDFSSSIAIRPDIPFSYHNRAIAYEAAGDFTQAISDYSRAISLSPGKSDSYINRGLLYSRLGDYRSAIEDLSLAAEFDPFDANILVNRGIAHVRSGDYESGIDDFNRAIMIDKRNGFAYLNLGLVHSRLGDSDKMASNLRAASDLGLKEARELLRRYGID